jgi:hypothetical protein
MANRVLTNFGRVLRAWQIIAALVVLAGSCVLAYLIGQPAYNRISELAAYLGASIPTPHTEDERLAARLRLVIGSDAEVVRNIRVLSGFTNIDLSDSATAAVQADVLGNTPPGGDLYWVPRTGNISESYGLLLAMLIDDRKHELLRSRALQEALANYLQASRKKRDLSVSRRPSLGANGSQTAHVEHEVDQNLRSAARALKGSLNKSSHVEDEMLKDFQDYLSLSDLDIQPTISIPDLRSWLSAPASAMEVLASGEFTITTFDAAIDHVAQSSQSAKTQPYQINGILYGRQPKLLRFERASWFKWRWIAQGRDKARLSNEYANLFGPHGELADVPDSVFAVKESVYVFQVAQAEADKLGEMLEDQTKALVVEYPGGKLIAPASAAIRAQNSPFWVIKPTLARVNAVALVSTVY